VLAAEHATEVVATDLNARAVQLARLSTALSDRPGVDVRAGDAFEPVAGEQFDLVVANPPYVVSPESAYLFRDGGLPGDGVSEHVVRAAPAVLAPGAFASILIAWALDPEDPAARPRSWLQGSGCDALVLHTSTDDPIETAMLWNRELLDLPDAYADALDRWLAYYRQLGIEQLGYACVVLRKRSDRRDGWFEALRLPRAALRPAGAHVRRLFQTRDRLTGDADLLDRRLRVVEDAVVAQETRFADSRWQPEALTLRLESGLPFSAELDALTAQMIRGLDGTRTLREALATLEDDEAEESGVAVARRMLEIGFLELADYRSSSAART
jgi:hypothetical protein